MAAGHRLHVVAWLRRPGRLVLPDWVAITLGRHIWAWRDLSPRELAHELAHVAQWRRHGPAFAVVYLGASLASWRAGTGWYRGNRFEVEARRAAGQDEGGPDAQRVSAAPVRSARPGRRPPPG
ncbi:MAG: hypothetical protein ACRDHD_07335 [Candidatus Limnocylindria bacterium]